MGELNKQFEALPLIYQLMDDSFVFVEATQEYTRKNHTEHRLLIATVNGAWYAFQEQQSKIEQLEKEKAELRNKIKSQIELLESASKSRIAYNERERNILKSQADDLEGILRGES